MKRKYEGLIVLDTQGKDEAVDSIVNKVGQEIEAEGAKLSEVDQLGKRDFPFAPKGVTGGFFVNYHFEAEPDVIKKIDERLKLNTVVYQQHYLRA